MALANRCKPQRNSIITPKYAFSLLDWDLGDETVLSPLSGGGLRPENGPRVYVSYPTQCRELCAQPFARGCQEIEHQCFERGRLFG